MASNYHCENIEIISKILENLDANDAVRMQEAKKYISKVLVLKEIWQK